jgi:CheY-like chemotaxis protein
MAKILVVDDEYLIVDMLTNYLSLLGHEAIGAHSARQTWDRLAYEEPDLILLDIMLPDEDGLDILRKLRADPKTRPVPVIMVSAINPPVIREAEAAGANGYLPKPVALNTLKNALDKLGLR